MRSLDWADGAIELVDQTQLPQRTEILRIDQVPDLVAAIKRLSVRGAPAIGVAGAYGVALAAVNHPPAGDRAGFEAAVAALRAARPTAVNLARMVDRVAAVAVVDPAAALAEAHAIRDEELAASVAMGESGADLVQSLVSDPGAVRAMTICNTGGLATVERGTALAVIQTLHERGALAEALPLETRPLLQGGRLTTWELQEMGAPHRLLVDSAGPFLLARGAADVVLIGADRVAANGDTANKIGSFSLALGAAHAGVPFIVVAPESTVDGATGTGDEIEIEDRGSAEVATVREVPVAPTGTPGVNPAFDVTPVDHITALVTDQRVVRFDRGERL
ncbi:MAG: S-methyl-5-thioribose-1-phosphate isomerase [Actinomycetota bacterium]